MIEIRRGIGSPPDNQNPFRSHSVTTYSPAICSTTKHISLYVTSSNVTIRLVDKVVYNVGSNDISGADNELVIKLRILSLHMRLDINSGTERIPSLSFNEIVSAL